MKKGSGISKKLKIGYLQITDHLILGISLEQDKGRFQHTEVEPILFHDWNELVKAMRDGQIDGCLIINTLAMQLVAEGLDLSCLLLTHREGLELVVDKSIKKASDLKGKTIGVPHKNSTHSILLSQFLEESGVGTNSVKLKEIPPPDFLKELSRGSIDGYLGSEPFGSQAEAQALGKVLTHSSQIKKNHIDCIFVVQKKWVAENADGASELVESLIRSGKFVHTHPERASEIGSKFLQQSKGIVYNVISPEYRRVSSWDLLPIKTEFEEMYELGIQKKIFSFSKPDFSEFVQDDIAKRKYQQLANQQNQKQKQTNIFKRILLPVTAIGALIFLWALMTAVGLIDPTLLPGPLVVWVAFLDVFSSGDLLKHSLASLQRVFAGFIIAALVGIPIGLLIGTKKYLDTLFNPLIQIFRTISPISWIPLAILWFGIGNKPAIFIIFITAIFPILISTALSIKNIDPILLKVGKNFGASSTQMLTKVVLPAILPYVIISLRVALGISWIIIVAAEMVGMKSGLGFLILDARNFLRTDLIIAAMLVIGVIGFILDSGISWIERKTKQQLGF